MNEMNEQQVPSNTSDELELLEKLGTIPVQNARYAVYCLSIIGQIEGHTILPDTNKTTKYEHLLPVLAAIEQDRSVEGMLILLNTVGGDVEAGLALAEMIAGMRMPTVSLVLGGGHSIGIPLAVAAKESFIVPSASMTLHPVRMSGTILSVPQSLNSVEGMQDRILQFVSSHSHARLERLHQLMTQTGEMVLDFGTILDGERAVSLGLIDHLGSLSDALEALYRQIANASQRYAQTS